jgi:predicted alpha/beta-hydrolase family hydrolase
MAVTRNETRFEATRSSGEVSAIVLRPDDARAMLVLGHGAGAGMRHAFMESISDALADEGIATFRYQFPYMEAGNRAPNPASILQKTVRSAVTAAACDLPLFAGGKSMAGRMTSMAAADEPLEGVVGIVFLGFSLHPPRKPGTERAEHLPHVAVPMLFMNGSRDDLADLTLLRPVCNDLDAATLHVVEGGDHGFAVLKRSGRTDDEVMRELSATAAGWVSTMLA